MADPGHGLGLAGEALTEKRFLAPLDGQEFEGNGAVEAGVLADAVVLLEPTELDLLLGGIGSLWLEIVVEGRAT